MKRIGINQVKRYIDEVPDWRPSILMESGVWLSGTWMCSGPPSVEALKNGKEQKALLGFLWRLPYVGMIGDWFNLQPLSPSQRFGKVQPFNHIAGLSGNISPTLGWGPEVTFVNNKTQKSLLWFWNIFQELWVKTRVLRNVFGHLNDQIGISLSRYITGNIYLMILVRN